MGRLYHRFLRKFFVNNVSVVFRKINLKNLKKAFFILVIERNFWLPKNYCARTVLE